MLFCHFEKGAYPETLSVVLTDANEGFCFVRACVCVCVCVMAVWAAGRGDGGAPEAASDTPHIHPGHPAQLQLHCGPGEFCSLSLWHFSDSLCWWLKWIVHTAVMGMGQRSYGFLQLIQPLVPPYETCLSVTGEKKMEQPKFVIAYSWQFMCSWKTHFDQQMAVPSRNVKQKSL